MSNNFNQPELYIQNHSQSNNYRNVKQNKLQKIKQIIQIDDPPNDPTFLEVFETYISLYENSVHYKIRKQHLGQGHSYTLYEDIKLLIELSKRNNDISSKDFQYLEEKGIFNRTAESIRNRYKDFLKHLKLEDFQKMSEYLTSTGIIGFLRFEISPIGEKTLKDVVRNDPKVVKEIDRYNYQKNWKINKIKPLNTFQKNQNQNISYHQQTYNLQTDKYQQHYSSSETSEDEIFEEPKKKIFPSARLMTQQFTQCQVHLNEQEKFQVEELLESVRLLSKWTRIHPQTILERLSQCSGNFEDLDLYLRTGNKNILWTEQEDEALNENQEEMIKSLILRKGIETVNSRIQFLRCIMNDAS